LIVAEIALAVMLVVSAGLLIKSLWRLTQADPGFRPEQIVTARIHPEGSRASRRPQDSANQDRAGVVAFYDEALRRAREMTGVANAAAVNMTPLSNEVPILPVEVEGHPINPGQKLWPNFWAGAVTPGYFQIMRIPLLAGRLFTEADGEKSAGVVLVSA